MMSKLVRPLVGAVIAASLTASAFAAEIPLPKILMSLPGAGGMHVIKKVPLAKDNLVAWVVDAKGRTSVLYTDPTGTKFMFLGLLIEPGGKNVTAELIQQFKKTPDYSAAYKELSSRQAIMDGTKGPLVYALFDPDCIFCHKLWQETRAPIAAGKLRIAWLPVGFLKPSSTPKAIAILTAKNPLKALSFDESGFQDAIEEGGIKPVDMASLTPAEKAAYAEIQANQASMQKYGFNGTPTLLFTGADGKTHIIGGMPPGGVSTLLQVAK